MAFLYNDAVSTTANAHIKMNMQEYFYCMFHYRKNQPNPYLCYGLLSSQAKVDARTSLDESRLWYMVDNQSDL